MDTNSQSPNPENIRMIYNQMCTSYHSVDDFRAKLLGFLPLVSGTATYSLIKDGSSTHYVHEIAWLGVLFTFGLIIYGLKGIQKCTFYIASGKTIEEHMLQDTSFKGQFMMLTDGRKLMSKFFTEPVASAIVYAAVLSAWVYVATTKMVKDQDGVDVLNGNFDLAGSIGLLAFALVIVHWKILSKPKGK